MIVDIRVKYPDQLGNFLQMYPVAANKKNELFDQKEMWLFRTGLIKFKDYTK